ncbi:hypothetical protein P5P86_11425 [Nocardioides sp. BP30]|uniref:hypothetical protein n=1 Tax=Nocardioides sp. BP30 TaxID=3036374 RepID=UPI0024688940|nr:hypothetical protein [Nocardioides sp. BP30]WGL50573.1 hypothetical protein P5P86_11425 [Nocardioides sp. BP30]
MTESSTPEHQLPAPGFVPRPFWADPVVPGAAGSEDEEGAAPYGGAPTGLPTFAVPRPSPPVLDGPDPVSDAVLEQTLDPLADQRDAEFTEVGSADDGATQEAEKPESTEDGEDGEDDPERADDPDDPDDADESAEDGGAGALRRRFEELVEERERRARYAHHLTRPVFTPAESAMASLVERRAAVWVPTMTFVATVVSAIAAVVLATRLRSDPTDPTGNQLVVVTVTVCLLAAAFATLLRAEVHYERLRPRGRVVRHDIADAYEMVRDAPRRLVNNDAPIEVLRRIAGLLPAAEQLVDALAAYSADGGTRVRAHPAYERIVRMRAEVEALEVMLEEQEKSAVPDPVHGVDTPLPKPEHVADYNGLVDLAEALLPDE